MSTPRRPGGQPGNTNALKHGFYSAVLDRHLFLPQAASAVIPAFDPLAHLGW